MNCFEGLGPYNLHGNELCSYNYIPNIIDHQKRYYFFYFNDSPKFIVTEKKDPHPDPSSCVTFRLLCNNEMFNWYNDSDKSYFLEKYITFRVYLHNLTYFSKCRVHV